MNRSLGMMAVLAACGGQPQPPTATGDNTSAPMSSSKPVDESECGSLFDHIIEVKRAELARTTPEDELPTDTQIAEIRAKFAKEMMPNCLAMKRAVFQCSMAASTPEAIATCENLPGK